MRLQTRHVQALYKPRRNTQRLRTLKATATFEADGFGAGYVECIVGALSRSDRLDAEKDMYVCVVCLSRSFLLSLVFSQTLGMRARVAAASKVHLPKTLRPISKTLAAMKTR